MFPRPRLLALIAFEAVERHDERALRALRPQTRVDVIELSRRGRHRHRRGETLREPVVIGRRAEWARPVRFGEMVAGEQIDEVEIRRVGQRPAPEPRSEEHTSELQSLMRTSY